MMTMSALLHLPSSCHPGGGTPGGVGGKGGGDEATSSLLSFVDMASSNIKMALDKPVRSKRKVNHRKYLQKQLKRCGGTACRKSGRADDATADDDDNGGPLTPPTPPSVSGQPTSVVVSHGAAASTSASAVAAMKAGRKEATQTGLQNKSLAALFDPRTLHERCCTDPPLRAGGGGGSGGCKVPLRQRNLPASFFTEPAANKTAPYPSPYPTSRGMSPLGVPVGPLVPGGDNNNGYFPTPPPQEALGYHGTGGGQRPSCRLSSNDGHVADDNALPDTVDRMLSGVGAEVGLLQEPWSAPLPTPIPGVSTTDGSSSPARRSSSRSTPCSGPSHTPDLLETALTAADVGAPCGKMSVLLSPATSSSTSSPSPLPLAPGSSSPCGVQWGGTGYHHHNQPHSQQQKSRLGAGSPAAGHHHGLGQDGVLQGPSRVGNTYPDAANDHYPSASSSYMPHHYPYSTQSSHHINHTQQSHQYFPAFTTSSSVPLPHHPTITTTSPSSLAPSPPLQADARSLYSQPEEQSRCGQQLPVAGSIGGSDYHGLDPGVGGLPSSFHGGPLPPHHQYHHPHHLEHHLEHHQPHHLEAYRDPSGAPYWQGTAVYGQLASCYSYL